MGLSTHVLDTAHGCPAAGMQVTLQRVVPSGEVATLQEVRLNADGRADAPLMDSAAMEPGRYRLLFAAAAYFRERGVALPDPPSSNRADRFRHRRRGEPLPRALARQPLELQHLPRFMSR